MAAPASLSNNTAQKVDTAYDDTGVAKYPYAVDDVNTTYDAHSGRRGVASHKPGDAVSASTGILVAGGKNPAGVAVAVAADTAGNAKVTAGGGTLTDRSGTITSGGASQILMAANSARRYFFIYNIHASEDLWFNFTTDPAVQDQPSIRLGPGQSYENPPHFCSTEKITIIGTTTGHKFVAKEG